MGLTKKYKGQLVRKTQSTDPNYILIQLEFENGERQWCSVREEEYNNNLTYFYDGEPADARIQTQPEVN